MSYAGPDREINLFSKKVTIDFTDSSLSGKKTIFVDGKPMLIAIKMYVIMKINNLEINLTQLLSRLNHIE